MPHLIKNLGAIILIVFAPAHGGGKSCLKLIQWLVQPAKTSLWLKASTPHRSPGSGLPGSQRPAFSVWLHKAEKKPNSFLLTRSGKLQITELLCAFQSNKQNMPSDRPTNSTGLKRKWPGRHNDCSWITTLQFFHHSQQNAVKPQLA